MKFKDDERVRLPAVAPCEDFPEGLPEEYGTIVLEGDDYPGMAIVTVDEEYKTRPTDDCLREVHVDDVEKI